MNQLPEAFLTRMRRQLEAEFEAYMTAMAQPPRRGGRVNGLKLSPEALFTMRPEFVPVGNEQFLLRERIRFIAPEPIIFRSFPHRCPLPCWM